MQNAKYFTITLIQSYVIELHKNQQANTVVYTRVDFTQKFIRPNGACSG